MQNKISRYFNLTIILVSILPGILLLGCYEAAFAVWGDVVVFSLFKTKETIAQLISGYSFTFLGFLLTITTVILSLPSSYRIKKYKSDGYFKKYVLVLLITTFYLVMDLILSILLLSSSHHAAIILKLMMMFFINSLFMAFFSFKIIFNLLTHTD